jgi:bifunctional ADP-heptose synthase (sugar kinase/adenylyltransferase)
VEAARLREITAAYAQLRVVLVGDIALDRYLEIDPALAETSIETGLPVRNVVAVRPQPGGGGNVLANLAALGPKALQAVGCSGDDGEGFELRRALAAAGVGLKHFLTRPDRMTFTYTKPLLMHPGRPPEELSRIDLRSRRPTPPALEDALIVALGAAVARADVIVAMDQVPEPPCGILTRRVKAALADLAAKHQRKVFIADSRTSISDFAGVRIKVNRSELARHFGVAEEKPASDLRGGTPDIDLRGGSPDPPRPEGRNPRGGSGEPPRQLASVAEAGVDVQAQALEWSRQIGRDVFVTCGEDGIVAASGGRAVHVPGVPVEPPIDVVGAGDSVLASISMALAAGATAEEAAMLGNLAGSVVVKKLGTTGTASVGEIEAARTRLG